MNVPIGDTTVTADTASWRTSTWTPPPWRHGAPVRPVGAARRNPSNRWIDAVEQAALFAGPEVLVRDLDRVEAAVMHALRTDVPYFSESASATARNGKQLRPVLALSCAYAAAGPGAGPAHDGVIQVAASLEMLHLGTLAHDDVMDEAPSRRGMPSINAQWGNITAILVGDVLMSTAIKLAARRGAEQGYLLASALSELCEGQARETATLFQPNRGESEYLESVAGKTASLFGYACRLGAIEAGLAPDVVLRLGDFGRELGMAFQIVDDLLDLTGTTEQLGKAAGNDMMQGVYTLPVIYALRESTELCDLLHGAPDAERMERARQIVVAGPGIEQARAVARKHTDLASAALDSCAGDLPPQSVSMLRGLAHHLLGRSL